MPYTTVAAVQAEFKKLTISATTNLTDTEVNEFISQHDAIIDARLGGRFVTPITGTEALKIVKLISTGLTVCRVQDVLHVRTGSQKTDKDLIRPKVCKNAEMLLEGIVSGKVKLGDATLITGGDGFNSGNVDNSVEPFFERGVDQW